MHDAFSSPEEFDQADEAERIALRRRVLDWRDDWSIEADARLSRLCSDEASKVVPWVRGLRIYELTGARIGFTEYPALPQIVKDAARQADWIIDKARGELAQSVAHHLKIKAEAGSVQTGQSIGTDQILAIGQGVAPFATAATLLAALPGFATTTTVTMFGLITTSTVSLPTLAAGIAGVGVLGYIGAINVGDIRIKQEQVLIDAIQSAIDGRLLAPEHQNEDRSLLCQLQTGLAAAATEVIEKIT